MLNRLRYLQYMYRQYASPFLRYIHYICMTMVLASVLLTSGAQAAPTIIRDAEIENALKIYAAPIFNQAGLPLNNTNFIIVKSPELNAFVAGDQNMFFYTGLLLRTETVGELVGVMAHETSHIASGHLIRTSGVLENASFQTLLSSIIGIAAAIGTGNAELGSAINLGGQNLAHRGFLIHSRTQESAADQGGIKFLKYAHLSPRGLLSFMQKLEGEELLPASQQSEYLRTHPLTRDRIDFLEQAVADSAYADTPYPAGWEEQHRRVKAKLLGFLYPQRALALKNDGSMAVRYARAIAYYRTQKTEQALALIDALLIKEPENPYFHELKGQILFETGQINDAIPPYRRAVELLPDNGLLRTSLAHALMETHKSSTTYTKEAIEHLLRAKKTEPKSTLIHRLLATAYGRLGQDGFARLHLAEEALLQNRLDDARRQTQYAVASLPENSPGWIRAQDINAQIDRRQKKD